VLARSSCQSITFNTVFRGFRLKIRGYFYIKNKKNEIIKEKLFKKNYEKRPKKVRLQI
jgi:hypothetical protein